VHDTIRISILLRIVGMIVLIPGGGIPKVWDSQASVGTRTVGVGTPVVLYGRAKAKKNKKSYREGKKNNQDKRREAFIIDSPY
jgi:hypothetical protein